MRRDSPRDWLASLPGRQRSGAAGRFAHAGREGPTPGYQEASPGHARPPGDPAGEKALRQPVEKGRCCTPRGRAVAHRRGGFLRSQEGAGSVARSAGASGAEAEACQSPWQSVGGLATRQPCRPALKAMCQPDKKAREVLPVELPCRMPRRRLARQHPRRRSGRRPGNPESRTPGYPGYGRCFTPPVRIISPDECRRRLPRRQRLTPPASQSAKLAFAPVCSLAASTRSGAGSPVANRASLSRSQNASRPAPSAHRHASRPRTPGANACALSLMPRHPVCHPRRAASRCGSPRYFCWAHPASGKSQSSPCTESAFPRGGSPWV